MAFSSNNRAITIVIMLLAAFSLVAWDVWAVATGPGNDSISHIISALAAEHFTIPFIFGIILGHWFWRRNKSVTGLDTWASFAFILLPATIIMGVVDIFFITPEWLIAVMPVLGYICGSFLWPMEKVR